MDNGPIGVFDSGVGGLTVLREIIEQLENENTVYFGDTARFPYGSKSADELKQFSFQIIDYLKEQQVKFVVIACNSASAAALEDARNTFTIPVMGVIDPGVRAAVQTTVNGRIGVIGTEAAISSGAYQEAILNLDGGVELFVQTCPELADFVERGEVAGQKIEESIIGCLSPILAAGIDTLILGCTHYPLIADVIADVVGKKVNLISSAEETARELRNSLSSRSMTRQNKEPATRRFIASGDVRYFKKLGGLFLGRDIPEVEQVSFQQPGVRRAKGI